MATEQQKTAVRTAYFTQLWERFSFFSLRAILVLYLVNVLKWQDDSAYQLIGSFGMLLCIMPTIGGYLTDRYIGYRVAAFYGGGLICVGHLCLTLFCHSDICIGLSFLVVGTGLMAPSLISMAGKVYQNDAAEQQRAFNFLYMSVNVGGVLAGVSVGYVAHHLGWDFAFGMAALGMCSGMVVFARGWKKISRFLDAKRCQSTLPQHYFMLLMGVLALGTYYILKHQVLAGWAVALAALAGIIIFGRMLYEATPNSRRNLIILLMLFFYSLCFFVMYEQSGSSLMLFSERIVDRHLFHFIIPTPVITSLNPLLVIVTIPLMTLMWKKLSDAKLEPPAWIKVSIGLVLISIGLLILGAAGHFSHPSIWWLFSGIFFMTIGELFIGPVMLTAMAQYAPEKYSATMMGMWALMGGVASYVAAFIAKMTSLTGNEVAANLHYANVFHTVGKDGLIIGVATLIITPLVIGYFKKNSL